jgi:hypothetical protein
MSAGRLQQHAAQEEEDSGGGQPSGDVQSTD